MPDDVNAWIENATSRCWGETKTVTELQDVSCVAWLDHTDVREVVSVKAGDPGSTRNPSALLRTASTVKAG